MVVNITMPNTNNFTSDKELVYYAIADESITPDQADVKIVKHVEANGLNFLRFNACLQSFGQRNRNRRLWPSAPVRSMIESSQVQELIRHGTFVGESGHPVPAVGEVTASRIVTIDPERISHRITELQWKDGDRLLYGTVETLDDGPGSPGFKFMRHILQGLDPSFSLRSIVPQRRNPDGTVDVVGPGRLVSYDRVILPSHAEAYINTEIPIQNVHSAPELNTALEAYGIDLMERSEKVNRILDGLRPVMESATIDPTNGFMTVRTEDHNRIILAPEMKYRQEIANFFRN